MKKLICVFTAFVVISIVTCTGTIDIGQEEAALRTVIEQEKDAFFNRDFNAMAALWMQNPSSIKIYMSDGELTEFVGWESIAAHDKENIDAFSTSDYTNQKLLFSDYSYHVYNNSAWIMLNAHWSGAYQGQEYDRNQKRILAFEKEDGKWKFTLMAIYVPPQNEDALE